MAIFDIDAELEAITRALEDGQIDYALCGGIAVAVHGYPRATVDIDLIVTRESLAAALAVARGLGYLVEAGPMRFASGVEVRRVSRLESGEVFTLDLMPVTGVLEDVWQGRQQVSWRGRPLRVVSRDGLIKMKRLAGRSQDLADLAALGADDA
jgi:hypothetical protein